MTEKETKRIDPIPSGEDYWFWEAADSEQFLGEYCAECHTVRYPPRPMCPHCHSVNREHLPLSGRGEVKSWIVPAHPTPFGFDKPPVVALIELEEGIRMISNIVGLEVDEVSSGMKVTVDYCSTAGGHKLPVFKPADESQGR